jgi:hypothetical protein
MRAQDEEGPGSKRNKAGRGGAEHSEPQRDRVQVIEHDVADSYPGVQEKRIRKH